MKRLSIFLLCCLGLLLVPSVYAADGSATVTGTYTTPISIEEVQKFTFTLQKKPGASGQNVTISNLYQELTSTKQHFSSYSYTPGCIKITGNPGARVRVRITPSNTLVGQQTTITLGSGMVAGQAKTSCASAFSGSIYQSTVNGNSSVTLSSAGEAYILWFVGGENANFIFYGRQATFSEIKPDTFVANVTYEVWYE